MATTGVTFEGYTCRRDQTAADADEDDEDNCVVLCCHNNTTVGYTINVQICVKYKKMLIKYKSEEC